MTDSHSNCDRRGLSISRYRYIAIVWVMLGAGFVSGQATEDVVRSRRSGSEKIIKRKGTIVDWKGMSLTIESNGIEREIDNDEIVGVQTRWSDSYQAGQIALKRGDAAQAIESLQLALTSESREWAKRIIRSSLVDAFLLVERPADAIDQFLKIIETDPNSRFFFLAPLPWGRTSVSLEAQSKKWIQSRVPMIQLIGASWLIGGADREKGINILSGLARDIDPRIKYMATAQLWRTRANVNRKQIEVWQEILTQMPRNLRAGPFLVLGEVQMRTGQIDAALVSVMRVPILYPEQRSLSAAALYRAVQLLKSQKKDAQAKLIETELGIKFPQTIWAKQTALPKF